MGVMFNYDLISGSYTNVLDFDGYNGANPNGGFIPVLMTTGIPQVTESPLLTYPNPVSDKLDISLETEGSVICKIYDATGRRVYTAAEIMFAGGKFSVDMAALSSGSYYLEVETAGNFYRTQIIKE
jgi:hypothetical protein